MRFRLPLLLGTIVLFVVSGVFASPREYLFQDKRVCAADRSLCIHGTLSYDSNPRLLHLRARVKTASGPGLLRIGLTGANELGQQHYAPFEVQVRGNPSEIINHKMIPDYPDVQSWAVERIEFIAD